MKNMKLVVTMIFLSLGLNISYAAEGDLPWDQLNEKKSCVAYKTEKGMFLFASVDVIGVNCSINVSVDSSLQRLKVIIPVSSFDSDHGKRDGEVAIILGGESKKAMVFEAEINSETILLPESELPGTLEIKGKPHQVVFNKKLRSDGSARLVLNTTFSNLGVKVDSVGGGLIAAPREPLTLFGHISAEQVEQLKTALKSN